MTANIIQKEVNMKIAGAIMLAIGIVMLIRVIQFDLGLIWGFPILITGLVLLILGFAEKKNK